MILRYTGLTELKLHIESITPETEALLQTSDRNSWVNRGAFETLHKGRADDEVVTRSIPIDRFVASGRPGAILLVAKGKGIGPEGLADVSEASIVRFSDLGVTVKGAPETGLAWATSLSSGRPRPGTRFTFVSGSGWSHPWSGQADASGMSALPGMRDYRGEIFVKAAEGGDAALGKIQGNDRLSPWRLGVPFGDWYSRTDHRAFIYSDRDLYRPGETVHLNGLVRRMLPSGIGRATLDSVHVVVHEPQGAARVDTLIALDRLGGLSMDIPLSTEAAGGSYWIDMTVPGVATQQIGSGSFTVAAYRAPSFQVTTRVPQRTVTPGDRIEAQVQARYFFGSPVAKGRLRWTLTRDRTGIHPDGYEAFSFGDPTGNAPQGAVLGSGETALDGSGSARITVRVPEQPFDGFERLTFEAGVQDPTGDAVHGRSILTYSPASVAPGVEAPRRVVSTAEPVPIRVVILRADTSLTVSGTPLELTLIRRDWKSVRKLLVGGRIGYENTTRDTVIATQSAVSAREPITTTWNISEPGSYRVQVVATDSKRRRARAASAFYVTGRRRTQPLGAWEEDPFLSITLDKKIYRVGETARAIVSTPVHATRAILSIERESVIESRLVDVGPGSMVFDIPVKASYLPNVFVGVTLVEPELSERDAPNLPTKARLPRVRIGYADLVVDVSSRHLVVTASPDRAEYRPGDMASLDLQVHRSDGAGAAARISVAVVDEAVLALLATPDPDPFAFFYAKRGLAVRTDDTRLNLRQGAEAQLEEEKGEAGGGGEDASQYRSEFATVAYWNPAVFTDANGRARVSFKLPDNLTRFRVIAVAASGEDFFGTGKGEFRITKPVTLDPALPRFALIGDTFEAAVLVTNRTGKSIKGAVTMETNLGGGTKDRTSVRLGKGESRRVAFPVTAQQAGEAEVGFRAQFEAAEDAVLLRIPVLESRTPRTAAAAGRTTASVNEAIELPRAAIPGSSTLDLRLSSSIIAGAQDAFLYVLNYPHGCLEQEASRLLAVSLYRRLARSTQVSWADSLDLDAKLREATAKLEALSVPWGTFSFWPGDTNEAPSWALNYAMYALAQAKKSGAPIPDRLMDQAVQLTERGLRGLLIEKERMDGGRTDRTRPSRRGNGIAIPATTTPTMVRMEPLGILLFAATELEGIAPRSVLEGIEVDAFLDIADKLTVEDRVFLALAMQRLGRRPEFVNRTLTEVKNHVQIMAAGAVVASDIGSPVPPPMRTGTRATALTLLLMTRSHPEDP
ncbi:MAG TPA: MG2 domain-containing protein, partial [Candidatus Eisenbacteria bacterium]|nr:MG2 domain-containing protein [Candidatus Eisenbacteria bacterium]